MREGRCRVAEVHILGHVPLYVLAAYHASPCASPAGVGRRPKPFWCPLGEGLERDNTRQSEETTVLMPPSIPRPPGADRQHAVAEAATRTS